MPGIDSYAKLVLHGDGVDGATSLPDGSRFAHTMTAHGSVQVDTGQSKFGGASILFGAAGRLTGDGNSEFGFGTSNFVIDFWVRFASLSGFQVLAMLNTDIDGLSPHLIVSDDDLWFRANGATRIVGTNVFAINTWYHVALVRSLGTTRLFVDGVQKGSNYSDSLNYVTTSGAPLFGGDADNASLLDGWMDEIRVSKRTDRGWAGGFTPPVAAYSEDDPGDTLKLLLHLNGIDGSTTITDSSASAHSCTVVNDAEIDTAQSRFGGAAIVLDGTDGIEVPSSSDWDIPVDDFVLDCWVRLSAYPEVGSAIAHFGNDEWSLGIAGTTWVGNERRLGLYNYSDDTIYINGDEVPLDTWFHVALVVSGNQTRLFLDGVQQDVTFDISAYRGDFNGDAWRIGSRHFDGQHGIIGWVDEFRVRVGTDGGWFSGFTPPAAAYSAGAPRSQAAIMG